MKVPFYKRFQPVEQLNLIEDALTRNNLASQGIYTDQLRKHFAQVDNIRDSFFVTSGSSALELALMVISPKAEDEFLIPSYNFPSAANAVLRVGGKPVICDTDPLTKNLSLEDAANKINKKTKGIIPTHYAGISCDMNKLKDLCRDRGLLLIEDAAQGVGSTFQGQALGNIGDFGAYSFHHTKNFSCGEGGAFLCKRDLWREKAEWIRDNGTDRCRLLRGEAQSYSWQLTGSNLVLGEVSTALLLAQMLHREEITEKRRQVHQYYHLRFKDEGLEEKGLRLMNIPDWAGLNYHIYYLDCRSLKQREILRESLLELGIDARAHYVPLHRSKLGQFMGLSDRDFPGSQKIADRILRLPIHTEMSKEDLDLVAESLLNLVKVL